MSSTKSLPEREAGKAAIVALVFVVVAGVFAILFAQKARQNAELTDRVEELKNRAAAAAENEAKAPANPGPEPKSADAEAELQSLKQQIAEARREAEAQRLLAEEATTEQGRLREERDRLAETLADEARQNTELRRTIVELDEKLRRLESSGDGRRPTEETHDHEDHRDP